MAFSITCATHTLNKLIMQSLTSTGVASPIHEPGYTTDASDGRVFQYIQFDSSGVAAVAGAPCAWAQTTSDNEFVVTADVSDGGNIACGCFLSVLTDTYYGWIQTKGFARDVPSTSGAGADVAAADPLYAADGLWTKGTQGTQYMKAVAVEAGSGGYGNAVMLDG